MAPESYRVELQPMALQPNQQARQLVVVQPPPVGRSQPLQPLAPGFPPAAQPPLDSSHEDQQARRRVIYISLAIAVYVVLGTFLQYYFDIAALQEAMTKIHSVARGHGRHADFVSLLLSTFPQVGWTIAVGMIVPLCGYLGVKQNNASFMGCFSCCNALHCCCGLVSMACMAFVLMGASAAAPGVFEFLDTCDPIHCAPNGLNVTARARVVDCLAASTWEDYERRFKHGPRLSPECPKFFLSCEVDGRKAFLEPADQSTEPGLPWYPRQLSVFRKPLMGTTNADARQVEFRRRHHWRPARPARPDDPIAQCEPAESVEMFHKAKLLAPEMLPKLVLFFTVKLLLMIPFVTLGCFGFCWGKEMWSRLGQGYSHLSAPRIAPSEVALQPAMGIPLAPVSAEAQLAQPLILNAPPPVVALQQPVLAPAGHVVTATGSPTTT
eukprot:CAMPEP_0175781650 /NCGR_PEP_ID=MMETSP0097-20121207/77378_1 /TAXON_ID=311494 /ORGANISM="Alexandrium monilatum, Strain CCMP3105" /LENGTH=437 /DNA_ID=CAMNT_0017092449 /DNA_START=1 /DNA_END=1311 /DNA_ORIENTATION=-